MNKVIVRILCVALVFTVLVPGGVLAETTTGAGVDTTTEASLDAKASDDVKTITAPINNVVVKPKPVVIKTVQLQPKSVSASARKNGILVKWNRVSKSKGYYIYRATSKKGKYTRIKTITNWKTYQFLDKKINPTKRYYYKIIPRKQVDFSKKLPAGSKYASRKIVTAKLRVKKSFRVKAYAYTGGGRTRTGQKAQVGRIAVDPKVIKLGTWLYVEGYGICQASDTGGNIKGKKIDVYKNTRSQCLKWGVRKPRVYILG